MASVRSLDNMLHLNVLCLIPRLRSPWLTYNIFIQELFSCFSS